MSHVVRPLADDERDEAVAVCARAFWPDPLLGYFSRGPLHEYRYLPAFFEADLRDRAHYSQVSVVDHGDRIGGLAMWCPPGSLPRPAREQAVSAVRATKLLLRSRHWAKAVRLLLDVERRHLLEPHWYCALLATDPAAQGRGIASALLAPTLARCDEEGVPAYLETQKASNVAWYARHGFRETGTIELADTPKVWLLTRPPQG